MATAELPTQSSGVDLKGIASLADLFTGKNTSVNTNTNGTTNGTTNGSTNTGSNTTGNTNGTASTQNAGGVRTTGTTTTADSVTPEAVQAVVNSILQGSSGIAAIASGQARAGLYNSSTNQLLVDNLVAQAAAEGAKLNKSTTVTQDTTAADNRTTTSTQNQNNNQNQNTNQSTQQATTQATNTAQTANTVVQPQIKPTTAIGAVGGLTALGQLSQTSAGQALLKKLGLSSLISKGAGTVGKAAPGGVNDNGAASDTANGNPPATGSPVNPNASVNATGASTATAASPFPTAGAAPSSNVVGNNSGPLAIQDAVDSSSGGSSSDLISSLIGSNNGDLTTDQSGLPNGLGDLVPSDVTDGSGFNFGNTDTAVSSLNADGSSTDVGSASNTDNGASSDIGNLGSGDVSSIGGLDGSLDVNSDGGAFGDLASNAGSTVGDFFDAFDFAVGGLVTPQGNHNLMKQKMVANAQAKQPQQPQSRQMNTGARTHYATGGPVNVGLRVNAPAVSPGLSATTNDPVVNSISQFQGGNTDIANAISTQVQPAAPSAPVAPVASSNSALAPRSLIPTKIPSGNPLLGNSGSSAGKKHLDGTPAESGTGVDAGESSVGSGLAEGETGPVSAAEGIGLAASVAGLATGVPIGAVTNALGLSTSVPLSPISALVAIVNAIANSDTNLNPDTVDENVDNAFDVSTVTDATTAQSPSDNDSSATDSGVSPPSDNGFASDAANGNAAGNSDDGTGPSGDSGASSDAGNGNSSSSDGSAGDGGAGDGGSSAGGDGGGAGGDFAKGGKIQGPGTSTSDSIKAHLSVGEYVMNAAAVKAVGVDFLDKINNLFKPSAAKVQQGKRR